MIDGAWRSGIILIGTVTNCTVQGNHIYNIGADTTNPNWAAVSLFANGTFLPKGNIIRDNFSRNGPLSLNTFAVQLDAGVANTEFWNNDFRSTGTGVFLRDAGSTGTVWRFNRGYLTENSGSATVAAAATSIVVSHGLATTPTRVVATPTANPGSVWWIDTYTATQFTLHLASAPTGPVTFDWRAEVGEG